MEAVGLNVGTEDLKIVRVEGVLSELDALSFNNNISIIDTYGDIKIELETELKQSLKKSV